MANTTPTPPFAKITPPSPPLIVLLGKTDLILEPLPTLLSHEDLPLKHTRSRSNHVRFHPYKCEVHACYLVIFCWSSVRTGQAWAELSAMAAVMNREASVIDSGSPLSSARASPTPDIQIPRLKPLAPRLGNPQPTKDNDSESPLSSASPTPRMMPAQEPSQTSAVCVTKIRKLLPKGAGRDSLVDIIPLKTGLLETIKVCPC